MRVSRRAPTIEISREAIRHPFAVPVSKFVYAIEGGFVGSLVIGYVAPDKESPISVSNSTCDR